MAAGKSERFRPSAIVQPGPGDELDAGDGSGVPVLGAESISEVRLKVLTEPTRIQGSGFHIRLNPTVCIKTSENWNWKLCPWAPVSQPEAWCRWWFWEGCCGGRWAPGAFAPASGSAGILPPPQAPPSEV